MVRIFAIQTGLFHSRESHTINLKIAIDILIWSKGLNRRFSRNVKRESQNFLPIYSVVNFNMIGPFLTSLRCPKGQKEFQGPKNEDFEKTKKYL